MWEAKSQRSAAAILVLVLMLTAQLFSGAVSAQLLPPDCVAPGMSIQQAVDDAPDGGTVRLCAGIFSQQVEIRRSNIALVGSSSVLDGTSLTGVRLGVILNGATDVRIEGIEFRNFKNPLGPDSSSAIATIADTARITLTRNTFTSNGWSDIAAMRGRATDWLVNNNTFASDAFVHLLFQRSTGLRFENNTIQNGQYGMLLAGGDNAIIHANSLSGGSGGRILLTPDLISTKAASGITITGNEYGTTTRYLVWAYKARLSNIDLGGANTAFLFDAAMAEQDQITTRLASTHAVTLQTTSTDALEALFPETSQASTTPPTGILECGTSYTCTIGGINQLLVWATHNALNPNSDPRWEDDGKRLQSVCATDACVRNEFFEGARTHMSNHSFIEGTTVRLIEMGVRPPGASKAQTQVVHPLAGTFDVLAACRMLADDASSNPTNCASVPLSAQFGLNLQAPPSSRDYVAHESRWRMAPGGGGVATAFDKINGPSATLLVKNTPVGGTFNRPTIEGKVTLSCLLSGTTSTATGVSYCAAPDIMRSPPPIAGFLWCGADLLQTMPPTTWQSTTHHSSASSERNSGGWAWSRTCAATADTMNLSWDTFLRPDEHVNLSAAHVNYYASTTQAEKDQAIVAARQVYERAAARHLALSLPGEGMPTRDPPQATSAEYQAIQLDWLSSEERNIRLETAIVQDANHGAVSLLAPPLAADVPARLVYRVLYHHVTGDIINATFTLNLTTPPPSVEAQATVVTYAGDSAILVKTDHPANRDYAEAFLNESRRLHTFVVAEATLGDVTSRGIAQLVANITDLNSVSQVCLREFATGRTDGASPNVAPGAVSAIDRVTCGDVTDVLRYDLTAAVPLARILKVSVSDEVSQATLTSELSVTPQTTMLADTQNLDLTNALSAPHLPNLLVSPIYTTSETLELVIPPHQWNPVDISTIVNEFAPVVNVIALLNETPLPLTPQLDKVVGHAAKELQVTIMVPGGVLPDAVRSWTPEDKLMTISGLAGSSNVLTIGATTSDGHVQSSSRRGPSPTFVPKPDFVAPAPDGTTVGAVLNALPFVQAVVVRGLHHPDLVRALLSGLAQPVHAESGALAIYYEQGLGNLDLSRFVNLPSTQDLVGLVAGATNSTAASVQDAAERDLGLPAGTLANQPASTVLGAVAPAYGLLRLGVGATLLNVTIDTPALPQHLVVNFGVVNNERPSSAKFAPIDYDSVLDEAINSTKEILENVQGIDPAVEDVIATLESLIEVRALAGQRVTLNASHYHLFDLLNNDLLYKAYQDLLNLTLDDATTLVEKDAVATVLNRVQQWLPTPHHLTPQRSGNATSPTDISLTCRLIPVDTLVALAVDATLSAHVTDFLENQARQISCANDLRELLGAILGAVDDASRGTVGNIGVLTHDEYWNATFNQTEVGAALMRALNDSGYTPESVAGSQRDAYFGRIRDALTDGIQIINDTLQDLGLPRIDVHDPVGLTSLETNVEATSDLARNPFGLYIGLARMTSHNVTVYNPLTGGELLERDVTIPAVSLLWNNPTLDFNQRYRDGTGINDTSVHYNMCPLNQCPQNIYRTSADTSALVDGVNISLAFDWARIMANESEQVDEKLLQLANLQASLEQAGLNASVLSGSLATTLRTSLDELQDGLNETKERLGLLTNDTLAGVTDQLLETITEMLVARPTFQVNYTLENGTTSFSHIYPGTIWTLFTPYPYQMVADSSHDFGVQSSGRDGLNESYPSAPLEIAKYAQGQLIALNEPAANTPHDPHAHPREMPPACANISAANCTSYPYFEVHGGKFGRYHQFDVSLEGFDLMGLVCGVVDALASATQTLVTVQGCLDSLLANLTPQAPLQLFAMAQCMVGERASLENATLDSECAEWRATYEAIKEGCAAGIASACFNQEKWEALHQDLQTLVDLLRPHVALAPDTLLVPFVHSPVRLLEKDPAALGITNATNSAFVNRTLENNPNATLQQVKDAIGKILESIRSFVHLDYTQPPARAHEAIITPQGYLQHAVDKITGIDWRIVQPAVLPNVTSVRSEMDMLRAAFGDDSASAKALPSTVDEADFRPGVNAGLAQPVTAMLDAYASGWRANGSVAPLGMKLPPSNEVTQNIPSDQVCDVLAPLEAAVPAPFFEACPAISFQFQKPLYRAPSGLDNAQFAVEFEQLATAFPNETAENLAKQAASLARLHPGVTVERTTDTLRVNSTQHPLLGALYYTMPITIAELVSARFDAEFYMENTDALLISTTNDALPAHLFEALAGLDAALDPAEVNLTDDDGNIRTALSVTPEVQQDVMGRVGALLTVINELATAANIPSQSLRVDAVGFPVAYYDSTKVADGGRDELCIVCRESFVAGTPAGYVNFSRSFDLRPDSPLDTTYHLIVVYFPTIPRPDTATTPLDQTFLIRNASFQYDTFAGIHVKQVGNNTFEATLGWSNATEDYSLLYAVPDQPFDAQDGLGITVSVDAINVAISEENIVRAPYDARVVGHCPDDHVVGFPTDSGMHTPVFTVQGGHWVNSSGCYKNIIRYLQPDHKNLASDDPLFFGLGTKALGDVLAYQAQVCEKDPSDPRPRCLTGEGLALGMNGRLEGGFACKPDLVCKIFAGILATARGADKLTGQNLTALIPFIHDGWRRDLAGDLQARLRVSPPVNAYLHITSDMLRNALNGAEALNANYHTLVITETMNTTAGHARGSYLRDVIPAQHLEPKPSTEYRALVGAYRLKTEFQEQRHQPGDAPGGSTVVNVTRTLETLHGSGWTGSGMATRIIERSIIDLKDTNSTRFLGDIWLNYTREYYTEWYQLGGNNTLDHGCVEVPTYDMVRPYFRCTGYSGHGERGWTTAGVGATDCSRRVASAFQAFANHTNARAADAIWLPYHTERILLSDHADVTASDYANATSRSWSEGADPTAADEDLLACIVLNDPQPHGDTPPSEGDTRDFAQSYNLGVQGLLQSDDAATATNAISMITHIDPATAINGPIRGALGLALKPIQALSSVNTLALPQMGVSYQLTEYWARMENAWINITRAGIATAPLVQLPPQALAASGTYSGYADDVAMSASNSHVYAFGVGSTGTIERYDPATNTKQMMSATFGSHLSNPSVVWTGDAFYIFGGRLGSALRASVWHYDPAGDTLSTVGALPLALEGTSAVWTGSRAIVFAGRGTNFALYGDAYEFDPATNTFTTTSGVVSPARVFTSASWDGKYAYVMGGDAGWATSHSTITRYDPATKQATLLNSRWEPPFLLADTWWDGENIIVLHPESTEIRALDGANDTWVPKYTHLTTALGAGAQAAHTDGMTYLFGGISDRTLVQAYDSALDPLVTEHYIEAEAPVKTLQLDWAEAETLGLTFEAIDDRGEHRRSQVVATRDTLAPTLINQVLDLLPVNGTFTTRLDLVDYTSGIRDIVLVYEDDTTTGVPVTVDGPTTSAPGEVLTLAVTLPARAHQTVGALSFKVTDRAGNTLNAGREVVYDLQPPEVEAFFENVVGGNLVLTGHLESRTIAQDDTSGLKWLNVRHVNESDDAIAAEYDFESQEWLIDSQDATVPLPSGANYTLHVEAEDWAGNAYAHDFQVVTVWVAPTLNVSAPYYTISNAVEWLEMLGETTLPEHPDDLVELNVTVTSNATGAIAYESLANTTGLFVRPWNASAATEGDYTVVIEARNGIVFRNTTAYVKVEAPPTVSAAPLRGTSTYARLDSDQDVGWFTWSWSGCGNAFTFRATSQDGAPIKLYVSTSGTSDPADRESFPYKATTNATSQSVRFADPTSGQAYTVVVTTANPAGTPLEVRIDREGCGSSEPDRPTSDLIFLEMDAQ